MVVKKTKIKIYNKIKNKIKTIKRGGSRRYSAQPQPESLKRQHNPTYSHAVHKVHTGIGNNSNYAKIYSMEEASKHVARKKTTGPSPTGAHKFKTAVHKVMESNQKPLSVHKLVEFFKAYPKKHLYKTPSIISTTTSPPTTLRTGFLKGTKLTGVPVPGPRRVGTTLALAQQFQSQLSSSTLPRTSTPELPVYTEIDNTSRPTRHEYAIIGDEY